MKKSKPKKGSLCNLKGELPMYELDPASTVILKVHILKVPQAVAGVGEQNCLLLGLNCN